jgi:hypothetical protein
VAHQPYTYSNVVTGQSTHTVPPALAWKRVRVNETLLWYNWKVRTWPEACSWPAAAPRQQSPPTCARHVHEPAGHLRPGGP